MTDANTVRHPSAHSPRAPSTLPGDRLPPPSPDSRRRVDDPPTPAIYPVSRSTWWAGVETGRFPGSRAARSEHVAWRVEAIRELVERERAA